MSLRHEVKDFTRRADILLNGIRDPLTEEERQLLIVYIERLYDKFLHGVSLPR
jgi:hypothetical protein